jgi:protein-L-isoaspartate(D-aspartate) O-methyltransferase
MVEHRGENPKVLSARFDRYLFLKANHDFVNDRNGRAFLLTPRDEFVLKRDIARAYERDFHDIGFRVTISGPLVVSRMTSTVDVQFVPFTKLVDESVKGRTTAHERDE